MIGKERAKGKKKSHNIVTRGRQRQAAWQCRPQPSHDGLFHDPVPDQNHHYHKRGRGGREGDGGVTACSPVHCLLAEEDIMVIYKGWGPGKKRENNIYMRHERDRERIHVCAWNHA